MKAFKQYLKKLWLVAVALAIMIGIPYLFGWAWLFGSWIPALFVMVYLGTDIFDEL